MTTWAERLCAGLWHVRLLRRSWWVRSCTSVLRSPGWLPIRRVRRANFIQERVTVSRNKIWRSINIHSANLYSWIFGYRPRRALHYSDSRLARWDWSTEMKNLPILDAVRWCKPESASQTPTSRPGNQISGRWKRRCSAGSSSTCVLASCLC